MNENKTNSSVQKNQHPWADPRLHHPGHTEYTSKIIEINLPENPFVIEASKPSEAIRQENPFTELS